MALENARLFDETQRLLTETNERAAELAIINSVQQGLAAKLDMQAMYDLVGDKIQEIFDAQVVDIAIYDAGQRTWSATRTRSSAACGSRTEPIDDRRTIARHVVETREPLLINDVEHWRARDRQAQLVASGRARQVGRCSFR